MKYWVIIGAIMLALAGWFLENKFTKMFEEIPATAKEAKQKW